MENTNRTLALKWWREMSEEQQTAVVVKHKFPESFVGAISASSSMIQKIFEETKWADVLLKLDTETTFSKHQVMGICYAMSVQKINLDKRIAILEEIIKLNHKPNNHFVRKVC